MGLCVKVGGAEEGFVECQPGAEGECGAPAGNSALARTRVRVGCSMPGQPGRNLGPICPCRRLGPPGSAGCNELGQKDPGRPGHPKTKVIVVISKVS